MHAHRVTWTIRRGRPNAAGEITHLGGSDWVLPSHEVAARIKAGMDACGDVFIVEAAGETAVVQVVERPGSPRLQTVVDGMSTDHLNRLPSMDTPPLERIAS